MLMLLNDIESAKSYFQFLYRVFCDFGEHWTVNLQSSLEKLCMQTVFMQIVHKYNYFGFQYGLHFISVNFNFSVLAYNFLPNDIIFQYKFKI